MLCGGLFEYFSTGTEELIETERVGVILTVLSFIIHVVYVNHCRDVLIK